MIKKSFLTIGLCLFLVNISVSQIDIGVQLSFGKNYLTGVLDSVSRYGHSQGNSTITTDFFNYPSITLRKSISNRLFLTSGIGYSYYNYNFRLKYYHTIIQRHIDTDFDMRISYMQVPIGLGWRLKKTEKHSLSVSAGLNSSILLNGKDNYNDIIFELIYLHPDERYSKWIASPAVSFYYEKNFNEHDSYSLGLTAYKQATDFINGDKAWVFWGISCLQELYLSP